MRTRLLLACPLLLALAPGCNESGLVPGDDTFCSGPDDCDPDDHCESDRHALGWCRNRPDLCPDVVDPVCGCDGHAYDNECEANAAGTDVDHRGPC